MDLKEKVQRLLDSDITAKQIIEDTGVTQSKISELRSGRRKVGNLTVDVAEKLAKYYDKEILKMKKIEFKKINDFDYDVYMKGEAIGNLTASGENGETTNWILTVDTDSDKFFASKNNALFTNSFSISTGNIDNAKQWTIDQLSQLQPAVKKVEFDGQPENDNDGVPTVGVEYNGNSYGDLKFDKEQNTWVLWPIDSDDAVSYFDDLNETKDTIRDELENADED